MPKKILTDTEVNLLRDMWEDRAPDGRRYWYPKGLAKFFGISIWSVKSILKYARRANGVQR